MRHTKSKPKLSHALSGMFTSFRTSSLRNDGESSAKERGGKSGILPGIGSINGHGKSRTFLPRTISRIKTKSGKMSVGVDASRPDIEKQSVVEQEEDGRQDDVESSHSDLDGEGVDGDHSPLHEACRCHPPSSLVRRLIEDDPNSVRSVNSKGQTPLHVAAAYGASPRVVEILTREYPYAATRRDDADRTPLHLACQKCTRERWCDTGLTDDDGFGGGTSEYSLRSNNEGDGRDEDDEDNRDSDKTATTSITESRRDTEEDLSEPVRISRRRTDGDLLRGPLLKVVRILLGAAPDSVHAEDDRGMTPLEYAINNGASVKVVKALHRASGVQWRNEQRSRVQRVSGVVLRTIGKALLIRKVAKTGASSDAPNGVGSVAVGSDGRRLGRISRKTKSCSPDCYPRSERPRKSNLPERKNRFSVW